MSKNNKLESKCDKQTKRRRIFAHGEGCGTGSSGVDICCKAEGGCLESVGQDGTDIAAPRANLETQGRTELTQQCRVLLDAVCQQERVLAHLVHLVAP